MEKRYQVFISSTFTDLIDERREVMQALLELNCIPAGMELFPASSDDQWTLIKQVIDDCDYYLVIVGGRYGSLDAEGTSYTEKEYDYAIQQGKYVLGFVHGQPGDIPSRHTDHDPALIAKLDAFRTKVKRKVCKPWHNADQLGSVVSKSLAQALKSHPAEGWVKYRYAKTTEDLEKVNQMHEQIRILEQEIARLREYGGNVSTNLSRGADMVKIEFFRRRSEPRETGVVEVTWDDVFLVVGRKCMDLPSEDEVEDSFRPWLSNLARIEDVAIVLASFQRVKVQFYALGLIRMEMLMRSAGHRYTANDGYIPVSQATLCWVLTEAGRCALADRMAEKRAESFSQGAA
jgi:hypothetical protein